MKVLLDETLVVPFNSKELYKKVLSKFDEYYAHQIAIEDTAMQKAFSRCTEAREEYHLKTKKDSTFYAMIQCQKHIDYVRDFEEQLEYLKSHFTSDEAMIYNYSIIERNLDKEIMDMMSKSDNKYYRIKRSCYLKIALRFNLIELKEEKNITNMVTIKE